MYVCVLVARQLLDDEPCIGGIEQVWGIRYQIRMPALYYVAMILTYYHMALVGSTAGIHRLANHSKLLW